MQGIIRSELIAGDYACDGPIAAGGDAGTPEKPDDAVEPGDSPQPPKSRFATFSQDASDEEIAPLPAALYEEQARAARRRRRLHKRRPPSG